MKKLVLSISVIIVFVLYAAFHNNSQSALPVSSNKNNSLGSTASTVNGTSAAQGAFKDGTYTGSSADAFYGTIQVKAIVQNGKLADVQFLQYPNDRDESIQINQQAMPVLQQEAIQAQNAQVDIVSGATDSSRAFTESLASALTQAK